MTVRSFLSTPTERQAALNVGTVESVAPGRIVVRLELDAPQATALNTGSPIAFPRLNGFVVVPNETGALVGIVVWLGVEHSSYPKRPGLKDFGLVDLPFPLRKMSVVPVGTLERRVDKGRRAFQLRRGVVTFPSVGDPVALPSAEQLDALTRGSDEDRRVHIGRALLGNDAEVRGIIPLMQGRSLNSARATIRRTRNHDVAWDRRPTGWRGEFVARVHPVGARCCVGTWRSRDNAVAESACHLPSASPTERRAEGG